MKFAFRADASVDIGSGHVMRCLTLADELRARGDQILFLCRDLPGHLFDLIAARGHALHRLPQPNTVIAPELTNPAHARWLGVDWQQDSAECAAALADWGMPDWLIVDHYAIDHRWEKALRQHCVKRMVVDDLADRQHDCDLLLDQNLQSASGRYADMLPAHCQRLLGPRFALLRPEFADWRSKYPARDGQLKRLLVFCGASDPHNFSVTALNAIRASRLNRQCHVDIVIGSANPHRADIATLCKTLAHTELHIQTPDMAALMAQTDLMIGAAGTTSWERCCLGLPAIIVSIADNQRENGQQIARQRAALYLGDASHVSAPQLSELLDRLAKHPSLIRRIAQRAAQITEGHGANLLALALHSEQLQLRTANTADCDLIWRWRNDPRTRQASFSSGKIELVTHRDWYQRVLNNPRQHLLIGSIVGQDIGVLRYDMSTTNTHDNHTEVSVYLDPDLHGIGLGSALIAAGSRWLKIAQPTISRIAAQVRCNNPASHRAFLNAGFEETDSSTDSIILTHQLGAISPK